MNRQSECRRLGFVGDALRGGELLCLELVDYGLAFGFDAGFEGFAFEFGVVLETLKAHAGAEIAAASHAPADIFVFGGRFSSGLRSFREVLDLVVLGLGSWGVGGGSDEENGEEKGIKCVFKRHAGLLRALRLTDKKMSVLGCEKIVGGAGARAFIV